MTATLSGVSHPGALIAERYVLRGVVATGGNARVLWGEDTKLGRPVAVKMLAPAFSSVSEANRRLSREGRLSGMVAHPNVCALLDSGLTESGTPYLVFELLEGETLADRLSRQHTLPVDQAVRIAEQLLAGIGAVHARGILHRDVKPSNVFLTEIVAGLTLVKLLDFGTAQMPGDEVLDGAPLTGTGFVVGTAEYMSPEQVRGVRDFDARTDIYSCGVVLYEMLSGTRPFPGRALAELLHSIAYERARPLAEVAPRVPRSVAHAVDVALATDRERRHPDAASFIAALRATVAPPMTSVTRVVGPATSLSHATADGDWEMATHKTGPPESVQKIEAAEQSQKPTKR